MNSALWAAKTGLDAQQTRMAVVSNNLANVNTTGFKKSRAVFEDLLYQNVRQVGAATSQDTQAPSGMSLGTGVRVVATEKLYTQGNLIQTGTSAMEIEGEMEDIMTVEKLLGAEKFEIEPRGYPRLSAKYGKPNADGVTESRFAKTTVT